jgi:hypothetical protein
MVKDLSPNKLSVGRGDFLLSTKLIPHPDEIFLPNRTSGEQEFVLGILDGYLKFLELVVFNERIFGARFLTFTEKEAKAVGENKLNEHFYREIYIHKPVIEEEILKRLTDKGIFFFATISSNDIGPRKIINDLLNISPQLKKSLRKEITFNKPIFKKNAEVVSQIALAEDIGVPICIGEFAKQNGLPFALHRIESKAIEEFELAETKLSNGVLGYLKEKLDGGAKQELVRINGLGIKTIYPETPIAWQIIRDSSKLEDFLPVALQLRDEYKKFRQSMINIEDEIYSDDITLKRKTQLIKELDSMAGEIWKKQENTTQKVAQGFSSLLDIALNQITGLSLGNFPKLLNYILGKPTEMLLDKLHQRKIKVVLNSKKQFMQSNKWADKISSIFSLSKSEAREKIIKYQNSPKWWSTDN